MTTNTLNTTIESKVEQFKLLSEKISHLSSISALTDWDEKVKAPKKGRAIYAKARGTLSTEIFKLMVSKEMGELLQDLTDPEVLNQLDSVTRACIREHKAFYDKSNKIPEELYKEYSILTSNANGAWEEARANNDFGHYLPYLEGIIEINKKFAEFYGYEDHPYDALLGGYEPGLTVKQLDPIFSNLRKSSVELLQRIKASKFQPNTEIFKQEYSIEKQKQFNQYILPIIGFDMEAGRLDETVHPFAQPMNTGDVRITTRYLKENVRSALFGTIHEAGHGIYEQGINPSYEGTPISTGASYGIHESQSRFLENVVGRSLEFWKYFYGTLQSYFPNQLSKVKVEDFYRAFNQVEPSFIRVEADELTYNLHIMIRYEIEKELIAGKLNAKDLPKVWNEKMEEYLGIVPPTDTEGVLQDVHWSFGGFGYFPSYTLGNLYSAQLLNTIQKELPESNSYIESGQFNKIITWLKENVHQFGKLYTPNELIIRVTGEELNSKYLVHYLEEKYSAIYQL